MKIRKNENFVIFCLMLFVLVMIFIISLCCFFGWEINKKLLLIYFSLIACILLISFLSYLIYIILCKSFIIFSDISIIEVNKNGQKKLIDYKDIWYSEYKSILYNFVYVEGGGYLLIYPNYGGKDNSIIINISKRKIKKISDKFKISNIKV